MNTSADAMQQNRSDYFGKYRGQVSDNTDPLRKGRLLVVVPQVLGDVQVWAEPCVPYAGPSLGLYCMPEVGTGVWVEFEAGDPSYPIYCGFFWNDGDIENADANPDIKFFKTRNATLRIDDANGDILIENSNGSSISCTSDAITIKSASVIQEASGGKKTNLSSASFKVNDGNLEVL